MLSPITLIIPTLNEEKNILKIFRNIELLRPREVLVVDANSSDKTRQLLKNINIITTQASRGLQLHTGAQNCKQPWILFLHADTALNKSNIKEIIAFIKKYNKKKIAYFKLQFDSISLLAKIIAIWGNFRTKYFHLPFGDQCLLISKTYYKNIGGYSLLPNMEDMDLVLRVPNENKHLFNSYIETSFESYEKNGILRQSLRNIFSQIKFLLK